MNLTPLCIIAILALGAVLFAAEPAGSGAPTAGAGGVGQEVTTPSGLKYTTVASGEGIAKAGDHVWVHYTGTFTDGKKFDSSRDRGEPIDFDLGQGKVIKGWDEGIAGMKIGDKRKLVIPPELGYGPAGAGGGAIPPNATLLFDVELVGIRRS